MNYSKLYHFFFNGRSYSPKTQLNLAFGLMGYLLGGFAIYKARNYQLTRTNWRGIYGNMAGSAGLYSLTYFGSILAKWCSLGWASPVMDVVMSEQLVGDMRFGDAAFKFKGRAGPLYPTYAMCWFMTIFVICAIGALWTYGVAHFSGTYFSEAFKQLADKSKNGQPGFDDMIVVDFLSDS